MRTTRTMIGERARKAVLEGVNAIYFPVALTLGPHPRKALMYRTYNRGSRIVDDGHIVAECQEPRDPFVRMAAEAFREACKRTNEKVGDGTATTAVIGGKLFNDCYAALTDGSSNMTAKSSAGRVGVTTLRRQILESAARVKDKIRASARKVEHAADLSRIATVSLGGDAELGAIIGGMAWKAGVDGHIDVVEGYKGEVETEIMQGFRFPSKPAGKAFVNNPARYEMVAVDCPVLVINHALDNGGDVAPMMQLLNQSTSKVVVVAPSFSDNVLVGFVNAWKQGYHIFPVKAPSLRTEQFEDLAVYCGARFIDKAKGAGFRSVRFEDLGFVEKLIVKDTEAREDAIATGGRGTVETERTSVKWVKNEGTGEKEKVEEKSVSSPIRDRVEILKGQAAEQTSESFRKLYERRIASMTSSLGVIKVGDSTQASSLDRKLKVEDAVYACKAALRGGVVRGGGLCLKEIADGMPETDPLRAALLEPHRRIQASVDGGLEIGDEIVDPAEAELYAVEHATSVVANLITVEVLTPESEEIQPGEGYMAIAREVGMIGLSMRQREGQLRENEVEAERDRLGGLTDDERIALDNG